MTALRTLVVFLLILALTVGMLCVYVYSIYSPNALQTKVVAQSEILSPVLSPTPFSSNWHLIDDTIKYVLQGSMGKYAVAVINLKTNEKYFLNEHEKFQTASLYKLWVMAEAYSQIQNGSLEENLILADNVENLNKKFNIASESAERTMGSVSMTVKDALTRMITYSDNYSALLLSSKVKLANVDKFLKLNNFSDSKIGINLPVTSAYDIAQFFEKIYREDFKLNLQTQEMINLLKKQQINRKLPRFLPLDTTVAHKTGELDGFSHDAGIVYTTNADYVIVVLSQSNNPKGAEERIAKISEAVFNFITEKSTVD